MNAVRRVKKWKRAGFPTWMRLGHVLMPFVRIFFVFTLVRLALGSGTLGMELITILFPMARL